jgi:hypothetical protein
MQPSEDKGEVARDETFDEFLAEQGLLAVCEALALKEIIADRVKAPNKSQW